MLAFFSAVLEVCPRTIKTCNYRERAFSWRWQGRERLAKRLNQLLLKVKLLQVLSEPQRKVFSGESPSNEKMCKPLGAFCCPVLLYKHLDLADGPLELFCKACLPSHCYFLIHPAGS